MRSPQLWILRRHGVGFGYLAKERFHLAGWHESDQDSTAGTPRIRPVFLLTSEYDEPLARSIQEAMAMGLLVIGTTTGGSGELLVHEKTGLVFEPGDSQSLANQILRAIQSPLEMRQIKNAGQQAVIDNFDINHTINQIDQYLTSLVY